MGYEAHWGLHHGPFHIGRHPDCVYSGATHEEALWRLSFLVDHRWHLGVLVGESGSGKTLLLDVFAARMRQRGANVVKLSLLSLGPAEFLNRLATGLGANPDPGDDACRLWRAIDDAVSGNHYEQRDTVVLLDDVGGADAAVVHHVTRFTKTLATAESRVTIALATCPAGLKHLDAQLLDLAELRIDLPAWELAETIDFVGQALQRAGATGPVFADSALVRLYELTEGVPRRVSQLADLALLAGAGQERPIVDADTVQSAFAELRIHHAAAHHGIG